MKPFESCTPGVSNAVPHSCYPFEDLLLGLVHTLDTYQKSLTSGLRCSGAYLLFPIPGDFASWRRMFEVMQLANDQDGWSRAHLEYILSCNDELLETRLGEISREYFRKDEEDRYIERMQIADSRTFRVDALTISSLHSASLRSMCRSILFYSRSDIPRVFVFDSECG